MLAVMISTRPRAPQPIYSTPLSCGETWAYQGLRFPLAFLFARPALLFLWVRPPNFASSVTFFLQFQIDKFFSLKNTTLFHLQKFQKFIHVLDDVRAYSNLQKIHFRNFGPLMPYLSKSRLLKVQNLKIANIPMCRT
jgi:hypothetical protein